MEHVSVSVADLRAEPKFESERVSQLVYGEEVKLIERANDIYSLVEGPDLLRGYMKSSLTSEGERRKYKLLRKFRNSGLVFHIGAYVSIADARRYRIPKTLLIDVNDYSYEVPSLAQKFLGIPYLWGGTSEFGFDCSGITQRLYRFIGVELPRNSDWQMDYILRVEGFREASPGDLIFFEGHVAIYLGRKKIIHANGQYSSVTITDLSEDSAYSRRLNEKLVGIGRVDLKKERTYMPILKRYS